jgi:predicted homoserine dehydrogenase-like protein
MRPEGPHDLLLFGLPRRATMILLRKAAHSTQRTAHGGKGTGPALAGLCAVCCVLERSDPCFRLQATSLGVVNAIGVDEERWYWLTSAWRQREKAMLHNLLTNAIRSSSRQGPVRAGIIGCGAFGTSILAQARSVPLLEIPVVADQDVQAARLAYQRAGVGEDQLVLCDSHRAALGALEAGKCVIVADPLLLMELPLDVIVESTGVAEAGALHAEAAIRHGKHVAMVNKEADVTVGPILKHLADRAGLVYTAVDGDQHGLLIGLVSWARTLGLEVLCGGKARDQEIFWDPLARTLHLGSRAIALAEEEARIFDPPAQGEPDLEARRERLGGWGRIGNWDLVELIIAANATGLVPDLPSGVHCPPVYAGEIPDVLCPTDARGILQSHGVIDAVTCLRRPHEAGLGGGVFIVVTAGSNYAREYLCGGGVCHNSQGTATLITRPYHLYGIDTITSILAAALLGIATGAQEYQPRFDVLARAARDLEAGTILGGDHSPEIEKFVGAAAPVAEGRALPSHLATGNRLVRRVTRGTVITRELVEAPAGSTLWALRARQDAHFLGS